MALHYNYTQSKAYAEHIGVAWLGDDYEGLIHADNDAFSVGMDQDQVNVVMRHMLWHVKWLLTPDHYSPEERQKLAAHFAGG